MMNGKTPLELDYSYLLPEVTSDEIAAWQPQVELSHAMLEQGSGLGKAFLGWRDPRAMMPAEQLAEIETVAKRLRADTEVMVVVGIGGSYLGAFCRLFNQRSRSRIFINAGTQSRF